MVIKIKRDNNGLIKPEIIPVFIILNNKNIHLIFIFERKG